jgi:hypothetical protein
MITSKYITDILELLLDGNDVPPSARKQLALISDKEYQYTGSGVYIYFEQQEGIAEYKVDKSDLFLIGVKIKSAQADIEAEANLSFKDGLINYLEIWCYGGDYPEENLTKYTLRQAWQGSPGKVITIE